MQLSLRHPAAASAELALHPGQAPSQQAPLCHPVCMHGHTILRAGAELLPCPKDQCGVWAGKLMAAMPAKEAAESPCTATSAAVAVEEKSVNEVRSRWSLAAKCGAMQIQCIQSAAVSTSVSSAALVHSHSS